MKLREAGVILKNKDDYPLSVVIKAKKRRTQFERVQQGLKLAREVRHLANDDKRIRSGNKEHQPFQPRNEEQHNKIYLDYETQEDRENKKKDRKLPQITQTNTSFNDAI